MTRRARQWLLVGAFVSASMFIVWFAANLRSFTIRYHQNRLRETEEEILRTREVIAGMVALGNDAQYERKHRHITELVKLGAVARREYHCRFLFTSSTEFRSLWKRIMEKRCPDFLDIKADAPRSPAPARITVWCPAGLTHTWDEFIARHDLAAGVPADERTSARQETARPK